MKVFLNTRGVRLLAFLLGALHVSVNCMERSGRKHDWALIIQFTPMRHIVLDDRNLKQFYECMCSNKNDACSFSLKTTDDEFNYEAHKIDEEEENEQAEHRNIIFVCESPSFTPRSEIKCERQSVKDDTCTSPCSFFYYSVGSCCIAIGWKGYGAKYFIANKELQSSQCGGIEATTATTTTTTSANTTELRAGTTTETLTDYFNTTEVFDNSQQSTDEPINAPQDKRSGLAITLGLSIGLSLLFLLVLAIIVAVYLKRREEPKASPPSNPQPYSVAGDDIEMHTYEDQGECRQEATAPPVTSGGEGDNSYAIYKLAGNEYCSIADVDVKKSTEVQSGRKKDATDAPDSTNVPRTLIFLDQYNEIPETLVTKLTNTSKRVETDVEEGNVYTRLDNGRNNVAEDVTKSVMETYNIDTPMDKDKKAEGMLKPYSKAKTIIDNSADSEVKNVYYDLEADTNGEEGAGLDSSKFSEKPDTLNKAETNIGKDAKTFNGADNVYTRLNNGRNNVTEEIANSVIETYNIGTPMDKDKKAVGMLEPYSKAKTIIDNSTDSEVNNVYYDLEADNNGEEGVGRVYTETAPATTYSTGRVGTQCNEYFVLEDVNRHSNN